jgi:hypothetical protein
MSNDKLIELMEVKQEMFHHKSVTTTSPSKSARYNGMYDAMAVAIELVKQYGGNK